MDGLTKKFTTHIKEIWMHNLLLVIWTMIRFHLLNWFLNQGVNCTQTPCVPFKKKRNEIDRKRNAHK